MRITEFKAWFEGFTENIKGAPTLAQFEKITAKVDEIDDAPVTERIYLDRYVTPWRPYWDRYWGESTGGPLVARVTDVTPVDKSGVRHEWNPDRSPVRFGSGSLTVERDDSVIPMNVGESVGRAVFDSHVAMRELGRMEATSMAA